eukprot:jgi/Undpi1/7645/HiC_scaffold_23.g10118.m1
MLFLQEEDIGWMKVLFDFYDSDRDGKLSTRQACLVCTQLVQSAGFVKANQAPPGSKGGSTKHFYRMATRNASRPITSEQASCIKRSPTAHQ